MTLSHFLFLIAAEGFAGLVRNGVEAQCLCGVRVNDVLSIPLLQYADDTIFFCDGRESNLWCLKEILRSFEMVSGLKISFANSNVIGVDVEENVLRGISHFFACSVGSLPFKFLGIPVGENPRRASTLQPFIDNIKARLTNWRSRQLSIGGRLTLINTVLSSLPLYFFSFYKAPKKVLEMLERLQRRFLWEEMRILKKWLRSNGN